MDKAIKAKWIEALRSGRYGQTQYRLQSPDGNAYCCLGVLENCILGVVYDANYRVGDADDAPDDVVNMQAESLQKAGLHQRDCGPLIEMNDRKGANFLEIADYIEANL